MAPSVSGAPAAARVTKHRTSPCRVGTETISGLPTSRSVSEMDGGLTSRVPSVESVLADGAGVNVGLPAVDPFSGGGAAGGGVGGGAVGVQRQRSLT